MDTTMPTVSSTTRFWGATHEWRVVAPKGSIENTFLGTVEVGEHSRGVAETEQRFGCPPRDPWHWELEWKYTGMGLRAPVSCRGSMCALGFLSVLRSVKMGLSSTEYLCSDP